MERISRGAQIARLRIEDIATRQIIELKSFRWEKRVIVVAGSGEKVKAALVSAESLREDLERVGLVVVPFIVSGESEGDFALSQDQISRTWRYAPFAMADWTKWFNAERKFIKANLERDGSVLVIIIRLDGKVGARSVGPPVWQKLVDEVEKLPAKDRYGRP